MQSIGDLLFEILSTEAFVPLLQSAAFLAARIHSVSAEVHTTLTRAAFLTSAPEEAFCETAQSCVQVSSGCSLT